MAEKKAPGTKPARPATKSATKPAAKSAKRPAKNIADTAKSSGRGNKAKKQGKTEKLAAELKSLIPQLDEEGLLFLIEQARVHIYNMQVDALNKSMARTRQTESAAPGKSKAAGISLKISEDQHSYYLSCDNDWIMFNRAEMLQLAKIAASPLPDDDKRANLYRWFDRERRDIFGTVPIRSPQSEILSELIRLINKSFKVVQ
ncbi:MAG: hypothetical protein LBP29_07250 [Treponema sp.]|jgi:hypothetical protein|nr:hypothetical protein [Treponema sp.]